MAPLIEDEFFFSDHEVDESLDHYDNQKIFAPLHTVITATDTRSCRRSVSFDDDVVSTTYDVESLSDFTLREIKDTWYDGHDLRRMRREVGEDASQLIELGDTYDHDNHIDNDVMCFRGLESRTPQGMRQKKQNRFNNYTAVFLEIDFQEEVGFIDEDAIARACYMYSNDCLVSAQRIAKQDEIEAI
mmetsp:Transcript_3792/g.4209  ORF Transcript_3792/g.4209 Transcript_3792/m.4209 type:complete len:187 (-) Transcript_3792:28-588(-)|eukprot:CAMPEP_0170785856 /NCGR_PEP_ID=MMETSP0733-20121128/17205_1 /TAXON_ID=186038 /ORGANISM="Fragilariopsis kerguelensis, Strain L26-C5" /LENGTH=186 /DNA_ID=CAMNT_0011131489 /DNA_START=68 /DNA_END=628 /DNA_ORIENTATION=-